MLAVVGDVQNQPAVHGFDVRAVLAAAARQWPGVQIVHTDAPGPLKKPTGHARAADVEPMGQ